MRLLVTFATIAAAMGCGRSGAASRVERPPGSGVIQWGTGGTDLALGVAVGADGHVWVGGFQYDGNLTMKRFTAAGAVDLDEVRPARSAGGFGFSAALGTPFMMAQDDGDAVVVIAFDSAGAVRWTAQVSDVPKWAELAATPDGTAYVTLMLLPYPTTPANPGFALSRIGPDGTVLWTRDVAAGSTIPAVAADGSHVYAGSSVPAGRTPDGSPRDVAVVTRFTPDGDVVWTRQLEDPAATVDLAALAVPADGGVIATGYTRFKDTFVARWDADGNVLWRTTLGTANFVTGGYELAIAQDGSIAVAGAISGEGHHDVFVAKLDASGAIRWTRAFGTGDAAATGVAFDAASNVYVCGYASGEFAGAVSAGGMDQFLAKLGPDGELP